MLKAITPILHKNAQYHPGDTLPTDDPERVALWLEVGAAKYEEADAEPETPKKKTKAKAVTAKPGQTGIAQPSSGADNDLVGRVPEPEQRGVVSEPAKRPGRKSAE